MSSTPIDENQLGNAEMGAFFHAIAPYTVALLPPDGLQVGTGSLVRWKSKPLILTANHNLKGVKPSAMRFRVFPGGPLAWGPMTDCRDYSIMSAGCALPVKDEALADTDNDVVAIRLCTERLPEAAEFYELGRPTPVLSEGNSVIVVGFAWDNSVPLLGQARAIGVTTQTGRFDAALNARSDLSSQYDPTNHFLLPYTRIDEGVRPHGMSGAGAWGNLNHSGMVWNAKPALVGIQTSYFPKSKLIQMTRIKTILNLLEQI